MAVLKRRLLVNALEACRVKINLFIEITFTTSYLHIVYCRQMIHEKYVILKKKEAKKKKKINTCL